MSLADLAGGEKSSPAVAVMAAMPGPDTKSAASRLLKAIHANDVEGIEDALKLFCEAHEDSKGGEE